MKARLTIAVALALSCMSCRFAGPTVILKVVKSPGCTFSVPMSGNSTDAKQGKVMTTEADVSATP